LGNNYLHVKLFTQSREVDLQQQRTSPSTQTAPQMISTSRFKSFIRKISSGDKNDEILDARDAKVPAQGLAPKNKCVALKRNLALCQSCSRISSITPEFTGIFEDHTLHLNAAALLARSNLCGLCRLVKCQIGGVMTRTDLNHLPSTISLRKHQTPGKMWLHAYGLNLGELQWFAHPSEFKQPYLW
jgi:hypothetical protein